VSEFAQQVHLASACATRAFAVASRCPFGPALTVLLTAGSEVALLDRTLVAEALCAFEEQLHALAAAKAAYRVFVSSQVTFSL
jgi:hypothetical protein